MLAAYANNFTADTSGTSRVLTGFGHQPKLWIPTLTLRTAANGWLAGDYEVGIGAAAGASAEMAHCLRLNDGNAGGLTRRGTENDSCIIGVNRNASTEDGAYDLTSFDSDGLTLNISNAFGTAFIIPYLSLGGSDLYQADVLQIGTPNATGDQTYEFSGIDGTPTLLLTMGVGRTATAYGPTGALFLGAADVNGQWALMTKGSEQNPTVNGRIFRGDRCYAADAITGASFIRASLVSFGENGGNGKGQVTLNYDAVGATESQIVTLIALRGIFSHKVGTFTKATSSPFTNTLDLGGKPRALMLATAAMTAMGTPNDAVDHCRGSIGFVDDAGRHRVSAWQDEFNVATSNIASYLSATKALVISDNATASSDDEATATWTAGGVNLAWDLSSTTAYEVGYVMLGDAPTPPPVPPARRQLPILIR